MFSFFRITLYGLRFGSERPFWEIGAFSEKKLCFCQYFPRQLIQTVTRNHALENVFVFFARKLHFCYVGQGVLFIVMSHSFDLILIINSRLIDVFAFQHEVATFTCFKKCSLIFLNPSKQQHVAYGNKNKSSFLKMCFTFI